MLQSMFTLGCSDLATGSRAVAATVYEARKTGCIIDGLLVVIVQLECAEPYVPTSAACSAKRRSALCPMRCGILYTASSALHLLREVCSHFTLPTCLTAMMLLLVASAALSRCGLCWSCAQVATCRTTMSSPRRALTWWVTALAIASGHRAAAMLVACASIHLCLQLPLAAIMLCGTPIGLRGWCNMLS